VLCSGLFPEAGRAICCLVVTKHQDDRGGLFEKDLELAFVEDKDVLPISLGIVCKLFLSTLRLVNFTSCPMVAGS
jgi:hypothetical protein